MLTVAAPVRVDLTAGFGDVRPLCDEQTQGRILNVAIGLTVSVTVREGAAPPGARPWAPQRLADAVADECDVERVVVSKADSSVAGGGMGSSGALSVALAAAVTRFRGVRMTAADVARHAIHAEWRCGIVGGTQDQLASVFGGLGLVTRGADLGVREAVEHRGNWRDWVLVLPQGRRESSDVIADVLRPENLGRARRVVRRMATTADEMVACLTDPVAAAAVLDEACAQMRALHPAVVEEDMARVLVDAGARGAKPLGAGGVGAAWVALAPGSGRELRSRLADKGLRSMVLTTDRGGVRVVQPPP